MTEKKILSLLIFSSIIIIIVMTNFFKPPPLPAWILIVKLDTQENMINNTFKKQDFMAFPSFISAINQADDAFRIDADTGIASERTPPGPMMKIEHNDAVSLISYLGGKYQKTNQTYNFKMNIDGFSYSLQMIFSNSQPITM